MQRSEKAELYLGSHLLREKINSFQQKALIELKSYCQVSVGPGPAAAPDAAIEEQKVSLTDLRRLSNSGKNVPTALVAMTTNQEIQAVCGEYTARIESKERPITNTIIFLFYSRVQATCKEAQLLLDENSKLNTALMKLISYCEKQLSEKQFEVCLYQVNIPEAEYKQIMSQAKSFHYEGRSVTAAKVVGGTVGMGASIAVGGFL